MENQDNVQSPKPNPNPFPTTFVQADTTSFKQVVQMLTGSAETAVAAAAANPNPPPPPPPPKNSMGPKKPSFKALYERRNNIKNLNIVSCPLAPNMFPPRKQPEILSPSILDFPSLVLSPVTPLIPDPFLRTSASTTGTSDTARTLLLSEEEKAIADKGFYLHPSPRSSKDAEAPKLLPLFPVTSPRVSRNSSSSSSSSSSSCTYFNSHSGVV